MGCEGSVMEESDTEYDSTWDDEEQQQLGMTRVYKQRTRTARRNLVAARDMQNYRHTCRKIQASPSHDHREHSPNLEFYQDRIPFVPYGVHISEIHQHWFGDYTRLEEVHTYIQWLFPTLEPGQNHSAHVLTPKEVKDFCQDKRVKGRLRTSYKLMLDFYGIQLVDTKTGRVKRAKNWNERFGNLNRNTHNNLRITRILKCLGLLGFQHYQMPLVHFFLEETLVKGTLPQVKQSVLDYFLFAVLDKSERKRLIKFAFDHFEPNHLFVWCPRRIQNKLLKTIPQKNQPSQTPRRKVKRSKKDNRQWPKVELITSQNSGRNNGVQTAHQSKTVPRKSHPSARKSTLV